MNITEQEQLYRQFRQLSYSDREKIESGIPKFKLSEKHVKYCKLLLNRDELLSNLRKWSIVAEIGVDKGEFSKCIMEKCEPTRLHLIDCWDSDRYNDSLFQSVNNTFSNELNSGAIKIHRSTSIESLKDFPDNYFDWIYIDTDHSYSTTYSELCGFSRKMKSGGVIAGHDYSMGNWVSSYRYGVIEAVHQFCVEFDWELVYLTIDQTERQSFAIKKIIKD